jgi:hypothetical protein
MLIIIQIASEKQDEKQDITQLWCFIQSDDPDTLWKNKRGNGRFPKWKF